jgi:hypothetical protein
VLDVDAEIERLSGVRRQLWADGAHPEEVRKVTRKLDGLYEEKRINAAKSRTGTSPDTTRKDWRAKINKKARIESELERLISR